MAREVVDAGCCGRPGMGRSGLAWPGLAWPGLSWPGLAWPARFLSIVIGLGLVGCGSDRDAGSATSGEGAASMAVIAGNVVYRERIMLGPDAELEVQLEDISRSDAPAIVLASTTMVTGGKGPPYAFSIEYDASKIESRMRYALRAKITQGGRLRFTNTEYIDPFSGNPVEVLVQGVRAPPVAAAAALDETRWGLETLEGDPVGPGAGGKQVDLEFLPQEQRVGGFAGCNRYSGSYTREGSTEHGASLAFAEHMAVTMMACPEGMELEQRYLKVLARVDTFRLDGDELSLLHGAEQLATFRAL